MTHAEQALQAAVKTLFNRYPALCGFAFEKRAMPSDGTGKAGYQFSLSELAVFPADGADLPALLEGEIAITIADLLQDRPEAVGLITGRTFARNLH